jgi:hypothetical protein
MDGVRHLQDFQREKLSYVSSAEMKFFLRYLFYLYSSFSWISEGQKKGKRTSEWLGGPVKFF